ncbi:MAG: hypothetical protein ACYC9O_08240 [Candidatus Latescibacterota bacterium]
MRIAKTGNTPVPSPPLTSVSSDRPGKTPGAAPEEGAAKSISGRLSALFAGMDTDVTPTELRLLAEAFPSMSSGMDGIDAPTALRALLLLRNGISLSSALPQPSSAESPGSLFREASGLLDQAIVLLGELNLSDDSAETVRKLAESLGRLTGEEFHFALPGENSAGSVARALTRSGFGFEWRLLAWFRAGGDPGMLGDLLRDDLKGAILAFLGDMDRIRSRGIAGRKTGALEDSARNLLDRITGRQLELILENNEGRRSAYGEIPWGRPDDRMYAGVRTKGEENGRDDPEGPARFSLSLDIETTGLGQVQVNLRFSGKKMAATFILQDGKKVALAESMAEEFREMLRTRGYEPGFIRFAVSGEAEPYAACPPPNRNRIDRRG